MVTLQQNGETLCKMIKDRKYDNEKKQLTIVYNDNSVAVIDIKELLKGAQIWKS